MRQLLWLAAVALAACSTDPSTSAPDNDAAGSSPDSIVKLPAATMAAAFDSATVISLPPTQLPAGVPRLPGQVLELKQWTDINGRNLLVVTRTPARTLPARPDDPNETKSVSLYARQFVQRAESWQELWRLQDAVERCAFDTWLGPVPGAMSITDLDADGQTETTLLYRLVCRSDVSPAQQKLILREGAAKYALRGYSVVQYDAVPAAQRVPPTACCLDTIPPARLEVRYELLDGRYETEREFRLAPAAFLRFARQQWRRWSVEEEVEQL
ncbi:M949_RS01915 family surface polysaccharide biosynthesis protein [Hymenobacter canadensis]|uniref:Lipoprotein n=1 Tax=Hymenobacter canadensis TaxID=2999067 RepID=A0ABY7LQJ8_9BACT|nr:hypothetical protein [Hymenobacter canadensis]WBA41485.1 hypothetical protein O3303_16920 [Hymenobacter canadensis]